MVDALALGLPATCAAPLPPLERASWIWSHESDEEYDQPPSRALFRMNAHGSVIYPITATPIFDNEPKVMANGRLAFISCCGNSIGASGSPEGEHDRPPGNLGDLAPLPDGRMLCTELRPDGKRMTSDVLGVIDPRDNQVVSLFESDLDELHELAAGYPEVSVRKVLQGACARIGGTQDDDAKLARRNGGQ